MVKFPPSFPPSLLSPLSSVPRCSQICGIVLVVVAQVMQVDISSAGTSQCSTSQPNASLHLPCVSDNSTTNSSHHQFTNPAMPQDFSNAMLLYVVLVVAVFLLFVVAFRPSYRRISDDKRKDFEASTYVHSPNLNS